MPMSANDKNTDTQEIPAQKKNGQEPEKAAAAGSKSGGETDVKKEKKKKEKAAKKGRGLFGNKKDSGEKSGTVAENLKGTVVQLKGTWDEQPQKRKILILAVIGAILAVAIIATVALNAQKDQYVVLYPSLDTSEVNDVYTAVKDKGVNPKIENGNVMVPSDQYNSLLLELAAEGYPKSTLTYDISAQNSGLTTTESDKKTNNLHQLQDRIQATLKSISGVSNAIVTLTPTDDSDYVWQQANSSDKASASVLITMAANHTLNEAQVSAIKNLVSHSLSNLSADDVAVIDAKTGQELTGSDSSSSATSSLTNVTALECEQLYQKRLEQNVKKLLQSRYGSTGVAASAKVTLDFDKMMQEKKDLTRANDGKDAVTHKENTYTVNGEQAAAASGVAGEESNTDVPTYKNSTSPTSSGGTTQYTEKQDIDYGYIKTQVEKGQPDVKAASISVMVNDTNLAANKADLINAVAKSTGITADNISVMAINPSAKTSSEAQTSSGPLTTQQLLLLLAVIAAIFIIIVLVIVFRSKHRTKEVAAEMVAEATDKAADDANQMRNELETYKRQLEESARSKVNEKDQVAADEVRSFAKENPQITADLLRSWLKEGEQ